VLNLELISRKISEKRKQKGMTQEELADVLFVSRQAVSKWEMGKSLPSLDVFFELTKLFDVTIDYMLDNSELKDNDYQSMFMQYPRESVIYHFLNSKRLNEDIKNIFYLLTKSERKLIINRFLANQLIVDITNLWPYLSISERRYLLGNLISKGLNKDLSTIYDMLSIEERKMINFKRDKIITYNKKTMKGEKV
jgi:transcriptional regulator with XRE-family HTH domain